MNQYYILEIQQSAPNTYAHIVHPVFNEDATVARLQAESTYHSVLAAAAVSTLLSHSASLIAADGRAIMSHCYTHEVISDDET